LEGKVVLVTGGSDGLGAALVRTLAAEGAKIAFCGRDDERLASVEKSAEQLAASGGEAVAVKADVTSAEDMAGFVASAVERWGRLDALVNNAGQSAGSPVESITDETWDYDLNLKLRAAIRTVRLAVPHLRAAGGGSIINVLAISGKAPGGGSAPSSVSRAAGLALTKALSKELGPDNITVNAILIGLVRSGQHRRRAEAAGRDVAEVYAQMNAGANIPLRRIGEAEEFADLAAFLVSERARYISGVGINFDGGLSPVA
ncbi:MAG: SDR family oxidoreductase, partial [Frankiaceae bacterium]|nr:SDR family oxidoreductase [Frankiaceae bacterium]